MDELINQAEDVVKDDPLDLVSDTQIWYGILTDLLEYAEDKYKEEDLKKLATQILSDALKTRTESVAAWDKMIKRLNQLAK